MEEIVESLRERRCVLFGGAGLSLDAGLPDWAGLARKLEETLSDKGKLAEDCLPAIRTLLEHRERAPAAIDLMLSVARRSDISQAVREILTPSRQSTVAGLIQQLKFRGMVTTNYDRILDATIPAESYHLRNSQADLKIVPTAVASPSGFLIKVHGDIDDQLDPSDPLVARGAGFMVLSKSDFTALVQGDRGHGILLALHSVLQQNSILFLGYGFADPDISWMLKFLSEQCQFIHSSWYVSVKGERLPDLPDNVKGLSILESWQQLSSWLGELLKAVSAKGSAKARGSAVYVQPALSEKERRAFLAISQYLTDLESNRKLPLPVDSLRLDFPGPRRCPCESHASPKARSSAS